MSITPEMLHKLNLEDSFKNVTSKQQSDASK